MDCLTFISNLVASLAWPIATVIIALSLKTKLINLLGNFKKLKAGSIEAEFQKLEEEVKEAKDKVDAVSTKFDEADEIEEENEPLIDVNENERNVLESIINSRFVMRSVTGVANDTHLSKAAVNLIYSSLIAKGLLAQTKNKDGKLRWYPTNLGRRVAAK